MYLNKPNTSLFYKWDIMSYIKFKKDNFSIQVRINDVFLVQLLNTLIYK